MASILAPTQLIAQESDQTHPFLNERFQLAIGAFARQQGFKIAADGTLPEEEIDFDETLGVDDDDTSLALTFRWNFGEKWSLWGQYWKVNAGGGAVLTEDVEFEDLVFQRGDVDASAPVPNIGGWYYLSPSKRWLLEARLDWLDVSVGDYSGGIWNSSVGVQFQAFKHLGIALNYNYFSLNADVDSDDWSGGAELKYRGPFLALTANW